MSSTIVTTLAPIAASWFADRQMGPTLINYGTPEQIDRWLRPALRGELHDAYAVTEEHAGSDPSGIATTATEWASVASVLRP